MSYELSIVVPFIRVDKMEGLYNSILKSTKRNFELICIGPQIFPTSLQGIDNVKFIRDFGSPIRCNNIGMEIATGKLVTWSADDVLYFENSLDNVIDFYYSLKFNYKTVLVLKYTEGKNHSGKPQPNEYYQMYFHEGFNFSFVPPNCPILMLGLLDRTYIEELGYWDNKFQTLVYAYADLGIRIYKDKAHMIVYPDEICSADHEEGLSGTHAPIHKVQTTEDMEVFKKIYTNSKDINRIKLENNDWRNSDKIWSKRPELIIEYGKLESNGRKEKIS